MDARELDCTMTATDHGAFSAEYAAKKNWKLDEGLCRAIEAVIPKGASVNELGAGIGRYVEWMRENGWPRTYGYDGIKNVETLSQGLVENFDLAGDFIQETRGTAVLQSGYLQERDWSISVEVGEHIPEDLQWNFIERLAASAKYGVIVSYAIPGQRGHDHIFCRMPEWVACELGQRGWNLDQDRTLSARQAAGKGWDKKLLVFVR